MSTDFTKAPKEIITEVINAHNSPPVPMSAFTLSPPQVINETDPPRNTQVVATAVQGSGYRGVQILKYNRVSFADIVTISEKFPSRLLGDATTLGDIIPWLNNLYDINLLPEDYVDVALPTFEGLSGESHQLILSAAPNSLLYVGSMSITLQLTVINLQTVVTVLALDGFDSHNTIPYDRIRRMEDGSIRFTEDGQVRLIEDEPEAALRIANWLASLPTLHQSQAIAVDDITTEWYVEADMRAILQDPTSYFGTAFVVNQASRSPLMAPVDSERLAYAVDNAITVAPTPQTGSRAIKLANNEDLGVYIPTITYDGDLGAQGAFVHDFQMWYEGSTPTAIPEHIKIVAPYVADVGAAGFSVGADMLEIIAKKPFRALAGFQPGPDTNATDTFVDNWGLPGYLELVADYSGGEGDFTWTPRSLKLFVGIIKRSARDKAIDDLVPSDIVAGLLWQTNKNMAIIGGTVILSNDNIGDANMLHGYMDVDHQTIGISNTEWLGMDGAQQAWDEEDVPYPFANIESTPYEVTLVHRAPFTQKVISGNNYVDRFSDTDGSNSNTPSPWNGQASNTPKPCNYSECEYAIINETDFSDVAGDITFKIRQMANYDREVLRTRTFKH